MLKSTLDAVILTFGSVFLLGCAIHNADFLDNKTFRIIEVNGYTLPTTKLAIKAQFKNGKIFLVGTCNPTWGYYSLDDGHITFDSIGNLKQSACSELIELQDGTIQERLGTVPSARTENEFIRIGKDRYKLIDVGDQLHFVDHKNKKFVVLKR